MKSSMKKLNVGCGKDIRQGWTNLDVVKLPGVDVCHDINVLPLPFEANTFDVILCRNVLEYVDYIPILTDLHRILKPMGKLLIRVPHFSSKDAYADPTHRNFFTVKTFEFFLEGHPRSYYLPFSFSEIRRTNINFKKRPIFFYNYFLERLVNSSKSMQNLYEGSPLRLFPASDLEVTLVK